MKVAIVVGTRPEIIKMASLVHECIQQKIPYVLIHSNQHYSKDMDEVFFEDLQLPKPHYNLDIGSGKHGNQTGNILIRIEPILEKEQPDVVFVQGDTNTTAAAGLAASKLGIKIAHIEAGLRSYDKRMPEETNRIMTDHMSDYLFAVTNLQRDTLLAEGISRDKISVVGNTVADTLLSNLPETDTGILKAIDVLPKQYALVTIHRANNVDSMEPLKKIIDIFESLKSAYPHPLVWPVHPRTLKRLDEFNLKLPDNVIKLSPLSYFDFIQLEKSAHLIFTDSGGIQEEACILKVPCITLRENTERPETIDIGANILTGLDKEKILLAINHFSKHALDWQSPFGDGLTAKKILAVVAGNAPKKTAESKTISVIGLGYMGLPFACLLAEAGHQVSGFDIDQRKIELVNAGTSPFDEKGMSELLKAAVESKRFLADSELQPAEVFVISVPTPMKDQKCDLSYVESALHSIADVVQDGNLVILESTVRPKTCEDVIQPFFKNLGKSVNIAFCPERAIPGETLFELVHNDRIIGGIDKASTDRALSLYQSFVKSEIFCTTATTAETVKLMENSYRDINIAIANEFSNISSELGINVWEAIALANKHPRVNILSPGPGVGGHCIAIDSWFLAEGSESAKLIRAARQINDTRPLIVAKRLLEVLDSQAGSKVGVLGVAYKKNVDDCRETPAKAIADELIANDKEVKFFDPYVHDWNGLAAASSIDELDAWADALVLVTDHDQFRDIQLSTPLVDTRSLLKPTTI